MPVFPSRLWIALLAALPLAAAADFTEYEDQPFLTPGGAEVDALNDAEPLPEGGASFRTAFPSGVKLVRGNLDAGDIDAYQIQLASGDLLLAALFDDASGSFLDTALGVFTGTAPPAAALDDDSARGLLSRLSYSAVSTGVRRIGVTGFGDANWNGTHGESLTALRPYRLVLGVAADPPALRESDLDPGPQGSNDAPEDADLLPRNGALLGAALAPQDVDHFAIDLEEGDRLMLAVFVTSGTGFQDPVAQLFGPSGAPVAGALDDDGHAALAPGLSFTVPAGEAGRHVIAVSGFGDAGFDGSHAEGPFDYRLLVARERACPDVVPLISNLDASTAEDYAVAALEGGDHYYTDRNNEQSHVLVDVPEALECGEWIKTANDDKDIAADPHLSFTLSQDASVYIGYDTRATAEPAWLAADFTPLPLLIDIRDPAEVQEFDVLRRDFAAGPVELGGNDAPGANSNYVVVALPLDTEDPAHALEIPSPVPDGNISVTISGVTIVVVASSAQSADAVADALAAAVNANAALQALRVFALGSGPHLVTTGTITQFSFPPQVPLAPPLAFAALVLGLLAGALLFRRTLPGWR